MTTKRNIERRLERLEGNSEDSLPAIADRCGGLNIVYVESGLEDLPEAYPTVICNSELVDHVAGEPGWQWLDGELVHLPEGVDP